MNWRAPLALLLGFLVGIGWSILLAPAQPTLKERHCAAMPDWHPDCNLE